MNTLPDSVDILIVGAGPTGLSAALSLQKKGFSVCHVDKHEAGLNTSRAAVIHPRTLEVLEPYGEIVPTILTDGVKVPVFRVRDHERILMEVDYSELKTAYPYTVMIPQWRTEEILLAGVRASGGAVIRGAEITDLECSEDSVRAVIRRDGIDHTVVAKWIVACDGGRSLIREKAGIDFKGEPYSQDFVLADVKMQWPLERTEVSLFFSPKGLVVVAPLPNNHFRIVATADNAPEDLPMEFIQSIVDDRGPTGGKHIEEITWKSGFHLSHCVAEVNYKGRVLLCGDASHVHSPAGGQGMNTGIQDAISLGEPLARALRSEDLASLRTWSESRHRIADELISMTHRMTLAATLRSPAQRFIRNAAMSLASHIPGFQHMLAQRLSELDNR